MVENCLTTKSVFSEQYADEVKAMKAEATQVCPMLSKWGLGSNKVRLVEASGMRELVVRVHKVANKKEAMESAGEADFDISWIELSNAEIVPPEQWGPPLYARKSGDSIRSTDTTPTRTPALMAGGDVTGELRHTVVGGSVLTPDVGTANHSPMMIGLAPIAGQPPMMPVEAQAGTPQVESAVSVTQVGKVQGTALV